MLPTFLLMSIATAWVAYMIVETEGPHDIFDKMRGYSIRKLKGWTKLTCIYCTATQVGLLVMLASLTFVEYANFFEWGLYWMAVSGTAVVLVAILGFLETH